MRTAYTQSSEITIHPMPCNQPKTVFAGLSAIASTISVR